MASRSRFVVFRLDEIEIRRLEAAARRAGVTRSAFIRAALERHLAKSRQPHSHPTQS